MGFDALFEPGRTFEKGTVQPVDAGVLRITSGKVAVCDPSSPVRKEKLTLERAVPNGEHRVIVSRGRFPAANDRELIVAAMVRFTDAPVTEWIPALPEGEDPKSLEPGQFFGYGVDAGTACFVDASLLPSIDFDHFEEKIMPKLEEVGLGCGYAQVPLADGELVAFTTGAGDGFYTSFWGLDAKGEAACLVTEFRLLGSEVTKGREILTKHWPGTPPPPPSLSPLFEVGTVFKVGTITRVEDEGRIDLASGVLIVGQALAPEPEEDEGDDGGGSDEEAFPPPTTRDRFLIIEGLPRGDWPVKASIARRSSDTESPCGMVIVFADRPVASWECAIPRGVDPHKLEPEETTGLSYSISDGPILLAPEEALATLDAPATQAAIRDATKSEEDWKFTELTLPTPNGPARALALRMSVPNQYVFTGRDADGAIAQIVVPIGHTGRERIKYYRIVQETLSRITGRPIPED